MVNYLPFSVGMVVAEIVEVFMVGSVSVVAFDGSVSVTGTVARIYILS